MPKFIIQGPSVLKGEFRVNGFKNAATPILAASLLADGKVTLLNVPNIVDVENMIALLRSLGVKIAFSENGELTINPLQLSLKKLDETLFKSMRSSVLLFAPLLARFGNITVPEPGGCILGNRPITTHLSVLKELGVDAQESRDSKGKLSLELNVQSKGGLKGATVIMPEFSVTATENLIMAAVLAQGTTIIKNAAIEPHVMDLITFLDSMGARIEDLPGHTIKIIGVKKLHGTQHRIIPDQLEAGTLLAASALCGKGTVIYDVCLSHLGSVFVKLKQIGVKFETGSDIKKGEYIKVFPCSKIKSFKLQSMIYPGFPTDLQPQFSVIATQADGLSLIHEPLFDNRMSHIHALSKMGAQAIQCDPHRAVINGPAKLNGYEFKSPDIRAGMALVIAGMVAEGETIIHNAEIIDRGYERIDERLNSLGAKIKREMN